MISWIKKSLFAKLLIGVLLTVIFPFAISNSISYRANYDSVKKQILDLNDGAMHMGMREIIDCIDKWRQTALSLYDSNIIYMLSSNQRFTSTQRYYIYKELESIVISNSEIQGAMFNSLLNGDSFTYAETDFILPQIDESDFLDQVSNNILLSSIIDDTSPTPSLILYSQNIKNIPGYEDLGRITFFIELDRLQAISDSLINQSPDSAVFIYAYDKPLFASSAIPEDMPDFQTIRSHGNVSGKLNENKGIFILYEDMYEGIPISLVKFIPESIINASATSTLQNALIIQLMFLPLVFVFVLILTLMIVTPIKRILSNIEKVEMGEYEFEVPPGPMDELRGLEARFQMMARRIDTLINKEYRNILEISKAQLKVLQAQINPHFLYNMLQYLSTMALKQGAAEVSEKISELGSIFRYSMENEEEIVPLREEIRHINDYMSLQIGRFDNKINFSISCPDEVLDIHIPKMILQPLLENSIKHGIEEGRGHGSILIAIGMDSQLLRIRVIDNGKGIEEQVIENIRQKYDDYTFSSESGRGIGIINVLKRLKIYAGEGFKWSIKSKPFEATDVTLMIPASLDQGRQR